MPTTFTVSMCVAIGGTVATALGSTITSASTITTSITTVVTITTSNTIAYTVTTTDTTTIALVSNAVTAVDTGKVIAMVVCARLNNWCDADYGHSCHHDSSLLPFCWFQNYLLRGGGISHECYHCCCSLYLLCCLVGASPSLSAPCQRMLAALSSTTRSSAAPCFGMMAGTYMSCC